mmetsp:Transcript_10792/g.40348  ORF Transcript_10792/g.40348 Transcript_10792/m.40348 type:complete len:233 (+) Transcript_10792:701-1399(+)
MATRTKKAQDHRLLTLMTTGDVQNLLEVHEEEREHHQEVTVRSVSEESVVEIALEENAEANASEENVVEIVMVENVVEIAMEASAVEAVASEEIVVEIAMVASVKEVVASVENVEHRVVVEDLADSDRVGDSQRMQLQLLRRKIQAQSISLQGIHLENPNLLHQRRRRLKRPTKSNILACEIRTSCYYHTQKKRNRLFSYCLVLWASKGASCGESFFVQERTYFVKNTLGLY